MAVRILLLLVAPTALVHFIVWAILLLLVAPLALVYFIAWALVRIAAKPTPPIQRRTK